MDPVSTAALISGGANIVSSLAGGDDQQDPTGMIGFLPQASQQELELLMQAIGISGGLAGDVGNMPESLSLAALGAPVGGPSESQRALVEDVVGAQVGRLRSDLQNLQTRMELQRDAAMRGLRDARTASGVRGTTAGSAEIGRAQAQINQPLSEFANTAAAQIGQLRGGASQALLELPFREREMALRTRQTADQARAALMGNPILERFFRERVAQGAQVPLVPGEVAFNPFADGAGGAIGVQNASVSGLMRSVGTGADGMGGLNAVQMQQELARRQGQSYEDAFAGLPQGLQDQWKNNPNQPWNQ